MNIHRIAAWLAIWALFCCCTALAGQPAAQDPEANLENQPSQYEQHLLELINSARQNPLKMASTLGLKPQKVLRDLPELEGILRNGVEPLAFNQTIYDTACAHNADMFENNYYSPTSQDGRSVTDRLIRNSYLTPVARESLGMLGFYNFLHPTVAVELIFENLFKDELDPERTRKRNILAEDVKAIGICMGQGRYMIDGQPLNVYIAVFDFAGNPALPEETLMYELINRARANPLKVAEEMGADPEKVLSDNPEMAQLLVNGMGLLSFDWNLYNSATWHAWDTLVSGHFSQISLDGSTPRDRMERAGYEPALVGEYMRLLSTVDFVEPPEGARILFKRIFLQELNPEFNNRKILNPAFEDMGIAMISTTPSEEPSEENAYDAYYNILMVIDFGTEKKPNDGSES